MDNLFLRRWLAAFWLILAGVAVIIWVLRLDAVLSLDQGPYYVTTGFEDISLINFSRMRAGEPTYTDCFTYPYRASLFNWLFYRVYGTVVRVVNPSEVALPAVLRLVTAFWTVVGFAAMLRLLLGAVPQADTVADKLAAVGLCLVAWFGPFVGWWSLTVRPDVPAVVCEVLGLLIVVRGEPRLSIGRLVTAGVLFFCAWSFKQSAIGIFGGTLLALLLRREWLGLVGVGSTFTLLTATVLLTAEPAYFINLLQAPALAPFEWHQLQVVLYGCVLLFWLPLLLVGLAVLVFGVPAPKRWALVQTRPVFFLGVVGATTLMLNLLAARRPGCSNNYLFETWLVGMCLTGLVQRQAAAEAPGLMAWPDRLLFLAFTGVLLVFSLLSVQPLFAPLHKPDTAIVELMVRLPHAPYSDELLEDVRSSPRPILCDDATLVRLALGDAAGDVPVVDHTIYWDARRAGRLSQPDILERIRQREYVTIWLYQHGSLWEPFVQQAGYRMVKEEGIFRQYGR